MEFGRVPSPDGIDFALPNDHPRTRDALAAARRHSDKPKAPKVYLAAPVWNHDGFVGKIYPHDVRKGDYLAAYARQFEAIELNSTFYGVRRDSLRKWREAVPQGFRFCPKFPRSITHDAALVRVESEVARFADAVRDLGSHLGPVWAVLPPTLDPSGRRHVEAFVDAVPDDLQLAIELRHADWFRGSAADALLDFFEERGTLAIVTDTAGRRDAIHQRLTASSAIVRFTGNRLHPSDFTRIDAWIRRQVEWFEQGLETLWIFLHQPEEHETVELAEYWANGLTEALGVPVRAPERVAPAPTQGQLFGETDG